MSQHILLVDDDALLRRSLAYDLEKTGYRVSTAADADNALALAQLDRPDLILLDIGLPGKDGLAAIRAFQDAMDVPIIFLTARRREFDQVLGLELGADDYITKPFDPDVLLAHIKAVLRRAQRASPIPTQSATLTAGDLVIVPDSHRVTIGGQPMALAPREFSLLHALAIKAGHIVSVDELLTRVWGAEYVGEPQVVYVHIRWLREKLEQDPSHPRRILSVRGSGYVLIPQEE
jgi:DNA-binding response OmpR family regulator